MNINRLDKIKICHIVYSFEQGGVESLLVDVINNINSDLFEIHLIILTDDKLGMLPLLHKAKAKIHVMAFRSKSFKSLPMIFKVFVILSGLIRMIAPDIVHNHVSSVNLLIVVIAMRLSFFKLKHVRTIHSAGSLFGLKRKFKDDIRLLIDKIALCIYRPYLISVSKVVYSNSISLLGRIPLDNRLIYSGVDLSRFSAGSFMASKSDYGLSNDSLVVVYISRLEPGKNHEFLLSIWPEIIRDCPSATLCLAGAGSLKDFLISKAKDSEVSDSIIFLGSVSNVENLLSVSDVAVFPSSFEGFSIVMIEKLAMKLPVVASDIEPFKEIAIDGVNAFLVSLADRARFIGSILDLLNNADLRFRMGECGYLKAQEFSIVSTVYQYENYYFSCLSR